MFENDQDPEFGQVLSRLRKAKGKKLKVCGKEHECRHAHCCPESEADFRQDQIPISSNVYLCNLGVVHICSQEACGLYTSMPNQTCPISGRQYDGGVIISSYSRSDPRTWRDKGDGLFSVSSSLPAAKKKKQKMKKTLPEKFPAATVLELGRELVSTLLFSSSRTRCNQAARQENWAAAEKAKTTYIAQRRSVRQLPYLSNIYRIMAYYRSKELPLMELEYDAGKCTYYARVILQVWNQILSFTPAASIPPKLHPIVVGMGTLYSMRDGMTIDGVSILPADAYLHRMLPNISHLSFFPTLPKSHVTHGTVLVQTAYQYALHHHRMAPEQLILNVSHLTTTNPT